MRRNGSGRTNGTNAFAKQLRRMVPASWKRVATGHDFWFHAKIHRLSRPLYSGIGSILALHRVCPEPAHRRLGFNKDLEVTPEVLEQSISFFRDKGYVFVSLDEIYEILKSGDLAERRANKFVAFTIDDGYVDNYTHAYPIFKKHGVPFAIYVTTCFPDRDAVFWWYVLEEMLWATDTLKIELEGVPVSYDCSTSAKKEEVFEEVSGYLTFVDSDAKLKAILHHYAGEFQRHGEDLAMNWDQIIELSKDPLVTIGAHSRSHVALAVTSAARAHGEVLESKLKIEQIIGKPVEHFAYPHGGRRTAEARDFQIVKDCGFKTATTARSGNIFAAHAKNLECLPRISVSGAELQKDIGYLDLWLDGLVSCHENSFKRIVTV